MKSKEAMKMSEIELVKKEIKKNSLVLRSFLVVLILAIGTTHAAQVQEKFDDVKGKETLTSTIMVDEVDLYKIYKNQAEILDATTGRRVYIGNVQDIKEEKKLIKAKQKKFSAKKSTNIVRR